MEVRVTGLDISEVSESWANDCSGDRELNPEGG